MKIVKIKQTKIKLMMAVMIQIKALIVKIHQKRKVLSLSIKKLGKQTKMGMRSIN